ncbi:MAG: PKD domain-containing protein [bacterium]
MTKLSMALVIAIVSLTALVAPALADTYSDQFSTNSSDEYNYSATYAVLSYPGDVLNYTAAGAAGRGIVKSPEIFSYGLYSVTFSLKQNGSVTGAQDFYLIFGNQGEEPYASPITSSGSRYVIACTNGSTNRLRIGLVQNGTYSVLVTANTPFIRNVNYTILVNWTSAGNISVYKDGSPLTNITNTNYTSGYAGFSAYTAVNDIVHIDSYSINESAVANFTYSSTGLTASFVATGENLGDPGVSCIWNMSDGGSAVGCSAFDYTFASPGIYWVNHTVSNVAGTSYSNQSVFIGAGSGYYAKLEVNASSGYPQGNLTLYRGESSGADTVLGSAILSDLGQNIWYNVTLDRTAAGVMTVYLNGSALISATDTTYSQGRSGLAQTGGSSTATIWITANEIYSTILTTRDITDVQWKGSGVEDVTAGITTLATWAFFLGVACVVIGAAFGLNTYMKRRR